MCLAWCLTVSAKPLHAQEPTANPEREAARSASAGLVAPELLETATARLPDGAAPLAVPVQLEVDREGRVSACAVRESTGEALDAAACDAARQYHWKPGLRNGVPIVARVTVVVAFEAPPASTSPPPIAASAPPPPAPYRSAPQEVTVRGRQAEAVRLAQSSEAVTVQDMTAARRESASTGEVLARVPGVSVRRAGGLGSEEVLSLVGLSDLAILVDGVPMGFGSFPLGVSSFPVNLIERLEIYTGVVPLRFGAAALGGAINIITRRHRETYANTSLELSSFGTRRFTLGGGYRHERTGIIINATGFYDHADNSYPIDVRIPDDYGTIGPARVRRFHDAYRAYGGTLEVGVVDKPWARELFVGGYVDSTMKETQSNPTATVPYGEPVQRTDPWGVNARYGVDLRQNLHVDGNVSYAYLLRRYSDPMNWVYDWRGERVARRMNLPGMAPKGDNTERWDRSVLGRLNAQYDLALGHTLTASTTPTYTLASGDDKMVRNDGRDPWERVDRLSERKHRLSMVSGLEYLANAWSVPAAWRPRLPVTPGVRIVHDDADYRLQNQLFVKHYFYDVWFDQFLSRADNEGEIGTRAARNTSSTFGLGDSARVRCLPELMVKLSYEYATRLPKNDELFGDGALVLDATNLLPETSHNLNLTPIFDAKRTGAGDFHLEANGFFRDVRDVIMEVRNDRYTWSANVASARSLGVTAAFQWLSPGRYVTLNGSGTFQDYRNTSSGGPLSAFHGLRMPNQPFWFASSAARLHLERLFTRDMLDVFYTMRYAYAFYVGWEDLGRRSFKRLVPDQLTHSAGITYLVRTSSTTSTITFELQNLADAAVFDNFGIQRPGRSVALKLTSDFN